MKIIHGPNGVVYRDEEFQYYFMDDFGTAILLEGEIQEQSVMFMLTGFIYNKNDIGF